MKFFILLTALISTIAFAQSAPEVTPTPTDATHQDEDIKGALAKPTPEQKAKVEAPVKKASAKHKKAAHKAKKGKKAKKHKKKSA